MQIIMTHQNFGLTNRRKEILAMRHELIHASKTHDKSEPQNPGKELLDMQELALSRNFQDLDVSLKKCLKQMFHFVMFWHR